MADLTKDITYRGFTVNDEDIQTNYTGGNGVGTGIDGCVVDSWDLSDVDVVQFLEKRSLEDGMDAGEVFKGARRVRMMGTLYGTSRAGLYDNLADMRAAFDSGLAQADEPSDKGYQPLYFSEPTLNLAAGTGFPSGYIDKRILVIPRSFGYLIQRDAVGGDADDALAIPWQALLVARDPRIYGATAQDTLLESASNSGNLVNRGNHYAPLNFAMEVNNAAGSIAVTAGTSVFTITIPSSSGNRIIRVKGSDKIVTFEEAGVEVLNMGAIAFNTGLTWPQVAPGTSAYTVNYTTVTAQSGSHMWFWESYA